VDTERLAASLTERTRAVIVNSPNNPTGAVLSEENIRALCAVLREAEEKFRHPIYLIADEPYRELVYEDVTVPYLPNYYPDTLVAYSFSKSLSIPGERIGYIAISPNAADAESVFAAVMGAGRALGYVCAPVLFQKMVPHLLGKTADLAVYRRNRDRLFTALSEYGYECVRPDGAFYLFVRALEADAVQFCERAKRHELLLVPSDGFGCTGYVRIAYCVTPEQIERALPAFYTLAEEYITEKKHG
jgi:aspartate aminotransferase